VELPEKLRSALNSGPGRRLQRLARSQLRQLPCLHSVLPNGRCLKRSQYQSLGQDEDGEGADAEDARQHFNQTFGRTLVKFALLCIVGIMVLVVVRTGPLQSTDESETFTEEDEFKRDSPIVLFLAAVEILICGACAHTAALLYKRRRHALTHPAESSGTERQRYIKVHLEKEPGKEDLQLFGLCFRPSSDGLECLLVEAVREGSLLEKWNGRTADPSPEEVLEAALGDQQAEDAAAPDAVATPRTSPQRVEPGAAVLAVNEVSGDVGMMQVQLTKPKVTLWLRSDVFGVLHPSQMESEVFGSSGVAEGAAGSAAAGVASSSQPAEPAATAPAGAPVPTFMGRAEEEGWRLSSALPSSGPRCACMGLEDEEPQILMRWTVCGLVFGWVTMLPVLLMQPHEERPRQQLFRQYLLKPCLLMMPVSILFWLVDSLEVLFGFELIRPLYYFAICHMIFPAVLIYYLMRMQAADEKLVLEQRKARLEEAGCTVPVVVEDPAPMLLRELVMVNPVALVWLSGCAAIPLVIASLLTPMETARGKLAQGYVNLVYGPCVFLQVAFGYIIYNLRFVALPRFYLEGIGLLLSLPCFVVWSICLFCASYYGRKDAAMVEEQRCERAKEALKRTSMGPSEPSGPQAGGAGEAELVDCTEASNREWELVYSA